MNHFNKLLVTTFLSGATLFASAARAMDIKDYFKMADQDQGRFDQTLLTGAEKVLNDEGSADLAAQLDKLFTEVKPGEKLSDAMAEYQARLGAMLGAEVNREVRNPNLPHLQAERAFRDAAKDHGITLPPAFDTVASDFHLQFPAKDAPTPPPKPAATDSASSKSGHAPMIVHNPDGTFTIQKAPPKDAKGDYKGLVIPPQVVAPFVRLPEKKQGPTPQQKNP
jgi:hypothetical protein